MTRPEDPGLFVRLAPTMERALRAANPWWRGESIHGLKPHRRWAFEPLVKGLERGPSPAVVLSGPRRVGKTTLLLQVIQELIDRGVDPSRIFRVQFDDLPEIRKLESPLLTLSQWFEQAVLGSTFNRAANAGRQAFLFFDEVQNLASWSDELKNLVDINPVRVLVTGSSSLRIEEGRDSLAGRVQTLVLGPLLLREIAELREIERLPVFLPANGLTPLVDRATWTRLRDFGLEYRQARDAAFRAFSDRGGYPDAHALPELPWEELADHLNETVVRRAIQHDLRMGERGRKRDELLLEAVFRLSCRYTGQAPGSQLYLDEIQETLRANVGWQRVLSYLRFLDGALLIRLIEPLEIRLKKERGPPKVCICDHALRASWLRERVPLHPEELKHFKNPELAGHVAEGVVGQFLRSIWTLDVKHFPERGSEPEVDFVLTIGTQRIPVEVKYRNRVHHDDTRGLRRFLEKSANEASFGVIVTQHDDRATDDPRIVSLPLSSLLLLR